MDIALPPPEKGKPAPVDYGAGLDAAAVAELVRRIREGEEGVLDPLVKQFNDLVFAWQATRGKRVDHY